MMRTLFLQGPSHDGFDGGAGSRYQARREIRSFWFPTWLAQPAAMVPGSTLIDKIWDQHVIRALSDGRTRASAAPRRFARQAGQAARARGRPPV